jgi:hypothetical protein
MDAGVVAAIVIVVVVLGLLVAFWMHLRRRDHPEDTAGHDTRPTMDWREEARMAPYPGTDRPAGPGAEGMGVAEPGDIVPGPEPPNDNSGRAGDPHLSHGTGSP